MVVRIWPLNKAMDEKISLNKVSTNVKQKKMRMSIRKKIMITLTKKGMG
jgi:hypothetical protein